MREYIESNLQLIIGARRLADRARDNEPLHRIMMQGVFALEDLHELLIRLDAAQKKNPSPTAPSSPS